MTDSALKDTLAPALPAIPKEETPFTRFRKAFLEDKVAVAGLIVFSLIVSLALLAPFITPQNPYDLRSVDIMDSRLPPGLAPGHRDRGLELVSAFRATHHRASVAGGVMPHVPVG
jgi:peptide/nickel transport system permease protein